jgi:hypothetical protein
LWPAWIEYWKRILTDGYGLVPASRVELAIELSARTIEADRMGRASATFQNSLNRQSEGIGCFVLQSEQFTLLQGEDEDDADFARRELVWLLDNYKGLKAALRDGEVWSLYERINSSRALKIRLGTGHGWFGLEAGQEGFGTLPYGDQELLAGMKPTKRDPMEALTSGILTSPPTSAIEELTAALVQYTPPHFKTIHCTIKEGVEQGQRALFYQIECPEFPDDGTTVVNERVHRAATLLVQQTASKQGTFAGVRIKLNLQADGLWQRSVELIDQ